MSEVRVRTAVPAVVPAAEGGEVRGAAHAGGGRDVRHPLRETLGGRARTGGGIYFIRFNTLYSLIST